MNYQLRLFSGKMITRSNKDSKTATRHKERPE
jgi:hypothetical protein